MKMIDRKTNRNGVDYAIFREGETFGVWKLCGNYCRHTAGGIRRLQIQPGKLATGGDMNPYVGWFTDPILAIEEAEFLAGQIGSPHAVARAPAGGDLMTVGPLDDVQARGLVVYEVVQP